jgi:hypothetical protein
VLKAPPSFCPIPRSGQPMGCVAAAFSHGLDGWVSGAVAWRNPQTVRARLSSPAPSLSLPPAAVGPGTRPRQKVDQRRCQDLRRSPGDDLPRHRRVSGLTLVFCSAQPHRPTLRLDMNVGSGPKDPDCLTTPASGRRLSVALEYEPEETMPTFKPGAAVGKLASRNFRRPPRACWSGG